MSKKSRQETTWSVFSNSSDKFFISLVEIVGTATITGILITPILTTEPIPEEIKWSALGMGILALILVAFDKTLREKKKQLSDMRCLDRAIIVFLIFIVIVLFVMGLLRFVLFKPT